MNTLSNKLVSVVMPAYNAAKHIAATIDSVCAQTYSNWELLVVDDGSTDTTSHIVQTYAQQDARIKYCYQQNARQGPARNRGIAEATGEIIAFLDADDLWLPHKLAEQVKQFADSGADLIFCETCVFWDEFTPADVTKVVWGGKGVFAGSAGFTACLAGNPIPMLTVLTTKAAIARAGGFATARTIQNAEDYHLWLKMLLVGCKLRGYQGVLAAYREHSASVSGADRFNTQQVIEAKLDIAKNFPALQQEVLVNVNVFIRDSLYKIIGDASDDFFQKIAYYLVATKREYWLPLFKMYKTMKLKKAAVKSIYFIFNYL